MILFLFTSSCPYDPGAEQTFLSEEINTLKEKFDRVIPVPGECEGKLLPSQDGIEDNVNNNAGRIRRFAYDMMGKRVDIKSVAVSLDQRKKEKDRLNFFRSILDGKKYN